MLEGTVIENSLSDSSVIRTLHVVDSWNTKNWRLHKVAVSREEAISLGSHLADGPWYMHFWEKGNDNILVVFKNTHFDIDKTDKATWSSAIEHGKKLGIPEVQLDFLID